MSQRTHEEKLDPKRSGIALNQMIVLRHYHEKESCEQVLTEKIAKRMQQNPYYWHYPSDKDSIEDGAIARYRGLTVKQLYFAHKRLKNRGYLEYRGFEGYYLSAKGRESVEIGQKLTSGPIGPLTGFRTPKKGMLSHYVWTALRTKGTVTIADIISLMPIESNDYDKKEQSTQRLLHWFCKAHLVRVLPKRSQGLHPTSNGFKRYQLIKDLGPEYPIIRQRKHEVYDPNSRKNYQFKEILNLL